MYFIAFFIEFLELDLKDGDYNIKQTPKRSIFVPKIEKVVFRLYYIVIVKPNQIHELGNYLFEEDAMTSSLVIQRY